MRGEKRGFKGEEEFRDRLFSPLPSSIHPLCPVSLQLSAKNTKEINKQMFMFLCEFNVLIS